jgi:hypothetical protein
MRRVPIFAGIGLFTGDQHYLLEPRRADGAAFGDSFPLPQHTRHVVGEFAGHIDWDIHLVSHSRDEAIQKHQTE